MESAVPLNADVTEKVHRVPGYNVFHTFANGEAVIGMTEFKGRLIIATSHDIYEVEGKRLVRLLFERFNDDA